VPDRRTRITILRLRLGKRVEWDYRKPGDVDFRLVMWSRETKKKKRRREKRGVDLRNTRLV